jgi:hypothetical protein
MCLRYESCYDGAQANPSWCRNWCRRNGKHEFDSALLRNGTKFGVHGSAKDGLVDAMTIMQWEFVLTYATEYNLVEKIKIIMLFNLMIQQKHGKLVNLIRSCSCCVPQKKEIQLSFLKISGKK